MSNTYCGGPMSIHAVGATTTTTALGTNRIAIPVDSAGNLPRYIYVSAVTESYVKLGQSGVTATANDIGIQAGLGIVLAVSGATHLAMIQGTSTGKVNVVPLDNV